MRLDSKELESEGYFSTYLRMAEQKSFIWRQSMRKIEEKLCRARIASFEINCSDEGLWILIRKPYLRLEVS